jgi:hypothetical protein
MEAICSSETSVETRRTTRRHIPEDDTLHNHRGENLKSYSVGFNSFQTFFIQVFVDFPFETRSDLEMNYLILLPTLYEFTNILTVPCDSNREEHCQIKPKASINYVGVSVKSA